MIEKHVTKLIHEGSYAAEIDVTLIETDHEWAPYYEANDVRKLDALRKALASGDLKKAAQYGRLYKLTPIAAE